MPATLTNLLYHIVFSTKQRANCISQEIQDEMYPYIGGIIRNLGGTLLEVGGMPDHIHLLTRFPADPSVASLIGKIKSNSSRRMNQVFSGVSLLQRFAWQTGYAAFSVSASQIESVRRYVRNQAEHHRRSSFKSELITLLERHDIEYDIRYVFD